MARTLATDVQYILNKIPGEVYAKTFSEPRSMINFFGGLKPLPRNFGVNGTSVNIPIYYSQNSSFASYAEGTANPTASGAARKYYAQPFKRYHGAAGVDGLLQAAKTYQMYGAESESEIVFQMKDLMSAGLSGINEDLALDGSGNSGADIQGLFYHLSNTGTWNGTDKSATAHLQSYIDSNSGTDRALTKTLIDGVIDTMITTRGVNFDIVGMGDTAYHAYEQLHGDFRYDMNQAGGDLYTSPYRVDGRPVVRLPIDTNRIVFLRRSDWGLYYLPQPSFASDNLRKSEGPWSVEQSATGYDANDYVLRIYLTLVCKNPWAQAGLFDVERAS